MSSGRRRECQGTPPTLCRSLRIHLRKGHQAKGQGERQKCVQKPSARPRMKQARKHARDARDFNNIETRAVIKFFLQGKAPNEIQAILAETLACFLPGRAKDLSASITTILRHLDRKTSDLVTPIFIYPSLLANRTAISATKHDSIHLKKCHPRCV